jgi:hypothetical protein
MDMDKTARLVASFAGVALGSLAIIASCFVWVTKQEFGLGGSALIVAGIALIGLALWKSVKFGVDRSGLHFNAEIREFVAQQQKAQEASVVVAQKLDHVAALAAEAAKTAPPQAGSKLATIFAELNAAQDFSHEAMERWKILQETQEKIFAIQHDATANRATTQDRAYKKWDDYIKP